MEIRIDAAYSVSELQEIVDALLSTGVIRASEAIPLHKLQDLRIDFFDINYLLEPAFNRLVSYSNDSRKGWFDQSETGFFYEWFALQLLRGCPLNLYTPTCHNELTGSTGRNRFILQAGEHTAYIYYHHLNHPEFIAQLVSTVNLLLKQLGSAFAYYEIRGYDEIALFLLLTPSQYHYLLTNRLLHFDHVDYLEIDAWRSTIREEELPF
jgi:hypothetical protein